MQTECKTWWCVNQASEEVGTVVSLVAKAKIGRTDPERSSGVVVPLQQFNLQHRFSGIIW